MTQSASPFLRLGTRGSPLALAQANEVRARLAKAHRVEPEAIAIEVITTSGDKEQSRPLADIGGKGLFVKEIEQALMDERIDLAVHSAKDLPGQMPDGLVIAACLPREDPRDAFISPRAKTLAALPQGAVLGTSSPRRQALVRRMRPDLKVVPLRGNVDTRLEKLRQGEVDATLLAVAGLRRLGRPQVVTSILQIDAFLPAVGQGVIAIQTRAAPARIRNLVAAIDDPVTATALSAERAFLAVLDGSCRTPIAGHARLTAAGLSFRGLVARPDGSAAFETVRRGEALDAEAMGRDAGLELKAKAGDHFFVG
jgi:hydroxymethylbilane synthase